MSLTIATIKLLASSKRNLELIVYCWIKNVNGYFVILETGQYLPWRGCWRILVVSQENSPDIHPTPSLIGSQVFSSPFKDIKTFSYIKSTLWIPANMSNVPVVKFKKILITVFPQISTRCWFKILPKRRGTYWKKDAKARGCSSFFCANATVVEA